MIQELDLEARVRELVAHGHAQHPETFSIKADFAAHDTDNDLLVCVSEITTIKGVFVGYGIADKTGDALASQVESARLQSLLDGLMLAGVTVVEPQTSFFPGGAAENDTAKESRHAATPKVITFPASAETANDSSGNIVTCVVCGNPVGSYVAGSDIVSAQKVVEKTTRRHDRPLCAECSSKSVGKRFVN